MRPPLSSHFFNDLSALRLFGGPFVPRKAFRIPGIARIASCTQRGSTSFSARLVGGAGGLGAILGGGWLGIPARLVGGAGGIGAGLRLRSGLGGAGGLGGWLGIPTKLRSGIFVSSRQSLHLVYSLCSLSVWMKEMTLYLSP